MVHCLILSFDLFELLSGLLFGVVKVPKFSFTVGFQVLENQATGYASQHTWCLSQARKNWEGCGRKGIRHKNGGDGRGGGTN